MSLLVAMLSFSLAMSISPGPVNFIILSSGINYGIRQTFAFVSGATIGFTLLLVLVGLGFGQIIDHYPSFLTYLSIAGSVFIIYMGYLIASSDAQLKIEEKQRPGFAQGFFLQWLNPKAWLACIAGAGMFSSAEDNFIFLIFCTIYFVVCYLALFSWSLLGKQASRLLKNERRLRIFNRIMGGLLMLTACLLLYGSL